MPDQVQTYVLGSLLKVIMIVLRATILGMADIDVPSPWRRLSTAGLRGAAMIQRPSAVAVLVALLDRSLARIAAANGDARCFDREAIRVAADVWDNNTFPLFRAVTAGTRGGREHRALAALEWMAGLGEERRAWMLDQASAAGHSLDGLLAPALPYVPGRDYLGRVMPPVSAVTAQFARNLAVDYDLPSAEVRHLRVERAGNRLDGFLELAVSRAYPVDDGTAPDIATLDIRLRDITEVRFDSRDARGAAFRPEADGVSIDIGARGALIAASADLRPDDRCWHRSAAGRRTDATTPPRDGRPAHAEPPQQGHLGGNAVAAATLLHRAMLEIRMVRYAEEAHRVPLLDFHRAFAGAGEAIQSAGAHFLPHRREAAFRRLIETWARRGGPALADWFATTLSEVAHRPDLLPGVHDQGRAHPVADASPEPAPDPSATPGAPRVELRMASYSSAHTHHDTRHDACALLHLAVPPHPESTAGTSWRLRAVRGAAPIRFHLQTEAFQGTSRPLVTSDDKTARRLLLHNGALDITSRAGKDRNHDPS
ncbi:hypothetical protein OG948_02780 [Embleya sp. NBC_00888]|uniref:hypothetical protein n=1 Tax=Embleya sp. NBC_00888 TaxID=2975960 RepID=UPI00386461F3|nr:hypothetical protein OG948_02780 [Embleya sp. NBC_00888]